jgi:hypothetical protein
VNFLLQKIPIIIPEKTIVQTRDAIGDTTFKPGFKL